MSFMRIEPRNGMTRIVKGKRRQRRTKMVAPIRVRLVTADSVQQESQLAYTLDANERGVRFAGFKGELNPGDIIEIQHRHERSLFRVVWFFSRENSSEKQVGAECVLDKNIWGEEFPPHEDEYEESDD
jgi:hypothetical protein